MRYAAFAAATALILAGSGAWASQLNYAPVNPSFQPGNPYAGAMLQSVAQAQEKHNTGSTASQSGITQGLFTQEAEQALAQQAINAISSAITGGTATSGSFSLGNGATVSYNRAGGTVTETINDPTNGQTVISFPTTP